MLQINHFEKKIRSQNGEDGIIEGIFSAIGTTNKYFVEFGAGDGMECNTSYLALNKGWSGLMIDYDSLSYQRLYDNYSRFPKIKTLKAMVSKENIVTIFQQMKVPTYFDLLSIDIDGNDYWVWKELIDYKPRVVVIEYNASFPPRQKMVIPYNPNFAWDGTSHFGASLTSLELLGKKLGYSLIGTDSKGVNAFFLRKDLIINSGFKELTSEDAYHQPAYGQDHGGHTKSNKPYLKI